MPAAIIVAVDENGLIGKNNQLPWHMPADLAYFKKVTLGATVVMGRKTFESIGKPLPGRTNIIISRSEELAHAPQGVSLASSVEAALQAHPDCFIIGGESIYRHCIEHKLTDCLYLTVIHHDFGKGDAYFTFDKAEWTVLEQTDKAKDEKNPYDYSFIVMGRKA